MSQDGQCADPWAESAGSVIVATFPMAAGVVFDWHTHDDHQLAWAASGVLTVRTGSADWVLPPTRALWIPAGLKHETLSAGVATMRSLYLRPDQTWARWTGPVPVTVTPLLADLIGYMGTESLGAAPRERAEALLSDLLQPVPMTTIDVGMPGDERAAAVAAALLADPADGRTLAEWGRNVGASGRTLARAFLAGTGMPFGQWRRLVRLQAALPQLAAGQAVGTVARHVGYETPSAFVAAFRRETGQTPAAYFSPRGAPIVTDAVAGKRLPGPVTPVERLARLHPPFQDEDQERLYATITGGPRGGGQGPFALVDAGGALTGPFNAMLLQPGLGTALQALGAAVRFRGLLPARSRELAILVVAAHWASAFEQRAHEAAGRLAGLTEAELSAVRGGGDPGLADPAERATVRAARALARTGDLDDEEYAEAVAQLGEAGVFELTTLVGYYATLALQLRVFRVQAPE